ncbi:MAG: efflux RND transporter periplasmic adaptor subunit [Desulfobacteraceae bacterium]
MSDRQNEDKTEKRRDIRLRIILCLVILFSGVGGFLALASLKKPPAEVVSSERALKVEVTEVAAESTAIHITGYGEVRSLNSVKISAEVAGQVQSVHPRLEVGEVIPAGELLFDIDARDYAAAVAQSQAEVAQWTSSLQRLRKQFAIDTERMKTLQRSRDLAKAEFDRIKDLFLNNSVGTRSGVDRAEQAYNAALDLADQMAQSVAVYPIRIKETQSSLAGAKARLQRAQADLDRCRVTAPFTGRLTLAAVETGQYVVPGQALVTIADDTMLEIQVPLDSRDVRQWLQFKNGESSAAGAWFGQPETVACKIRWTEDKQGHVWRGTLHRVVTFDQKTRTVTVAVRISAADARSQGKGLPLVEGMFCEVEIPGRTLEKAYQVPRTAVSFKNTVFMVKDQRLKTIAVEVARVDNDFAYITGGLSDGDRVITTRLVDPLENALLEILNEEEKPTAE